MALSGLALLAYVAYAAAFLAYSWPRDDWLPFDDDYRHADLSAWDRLGWRQLCCAHSATIVPDPLVPQRSVVKFELRRGDPLVRGNQRAEVRLPAAAMGDEMRYAVRLFVPADWQPDPLQTNLVQWHSVADKLLLEGGPAQPLRLVVIGNEWFIVNLWDAKRVTKWPFLEEHRDGERLLWSGPLERGRWVDWEFVVRWAWDGSGRVRIRKDGVLVADAAGPNTYRDFVAPYMKFGLYVPAWSDAQAASPVTRRTVYFSRVQVERLAAAGAPH